MAEIKDVQIDIGDEISDRRKVSVTFTASFFPDEIGRKFGYSIGLLGEDSPTDGQGDASKYVSTSTPLYTFRFGSRLGKIPMFPTSKVKSFSANAVEMTFSESRDVSVQDLNEDPGVDFGKSGGLGSKPPPIAHLDEVYADVQLIADSKSSAVSQIRVL